MRAFNLPSIRIAFAVVLPFLVRGFSFPTVRVISAVVLAIFVFVLSGSLSQLLGGAIPDTLGYKPWLSTSIFQLLLALFSVLLVLLLGIVSIETLHSSLLRNEFQTR